MFIGYLIYAMYIAYQYFTCTYVLAFDPVEVTGGDNDFFCLLTATLSDLNLKQTHYNFNLKLL